MVIRTNQARSCFATAGTALDQPEFAHTIIARVMARWGWRRRELNERDESRSQAFWEKPNIGKLARPTGIEPVLRVPETLVISFSLRAREKFFYHRGAIQSTRLFTTALAIPTISW